MIFLLHDENQEYPHDNRYQLMSNRFLIELWKSVSAIRKQEEGLYTHGVACQEID